MKTLLTATLVVMPLLACAADSKATRGHDHAAMMKAQATGTAGAPTPAQQEARFQRMQQQQRLQRVLAVAEALELSEADTVKLQATMAPFADQRTALRKELREQMAMLHRAADGDTQAQAAAEKATARAYALRGELNALERGLFDALSQGLSPQKRARLALVLAHPGGAGMGPAMHGGGSGMRGRGMGGGMHGRGGGMGGMHGPGEGGGMHGPSAGMHDTHGGRGMGAGGCCGPGGCPMHGTAEGEDGEDEAG